MRTLYLLSLIYIGLFLFGCHTFSETKSTSAKDPTVVAIYTDTPSFTQPYHIVGTATLSEYNKRGIKRQMASIHDDMRKIAADLNGDAIIGFTQKNHIATGTVIAYQNPNPPHHPS